MEVTRKKIALWGGGRDGWRSGSGLAGQNFFCTYQGKKKRAKRGVCNTYVGAFRGSAKDLSKTY